MRRASCHFIFAGVASILLLFVIWQAWVLHSTARLIHSIQNVPAKITDTNTPPDTGSTNRYSSYPEVLLTRASALSAGGQFEQAETALVKIIDQRQSAPAGQTARYNLANHYLRQALQGDLPDAHTRSLIELAKQRYRDLLLINPANWDARYNLELALRVAPEITAERKDKGPPIKSVDVVVPDFTLKDLP